MYDPLDSPPDSKPYLHTQYSRWMYVLLKSDYHFSKIKKHEGLTRALPLFSVFLSKSCLVKYFVLNSLSVYVVALYNQPKIRRKSLSSGDSFFQIHFGMRPEGLECLEFV